MTMAQRIRDLIKGGAAPTDVADTLEAEDAAATKAAADAAIKTAADKATADKLAADAAIKTAADKADADKADADKTPFDAQAEMVKLNERLTALASRPGGASAETVLEPNKPKPMPKKGDVDKLAERLAEELKDGYGEFVYKNPNAWDIP